MASLLKAMGYGVVLIAFPATPASPGHVAVGVLGGEGVYGSYFEYNGGKYFYLETTNTGWAIGQIPNKYRSVLANIYDMAPVAILTHTWTAERRLFFVELQVTVSNLGSATAQGVYIFAGFDAGSNQVWNSEQSSVFALGVNEKVTVSLSLRVPYGEHTRLVIQVVHGGYAVDKSYSEWFDT
jgi:hypothetical protein